jgi:hypothetical protein
MFRRLYCYCLLGLALPACESRRPAAGPAEAPTAAPAPVRTAVADTALPFASLHAPLDSAGGLPVVRIDGQPYRVRSSARPDRTRRLMRPASAVLESTDSTGNITRTPDPALDSLNEANGYGYDAEYTVQLLGPGGRPRFTASVRKTDFAASMGGLQHVAESTVGPPTLLGYLPQFHALAFDVSFYLEGTDDGGEALLLLDARTGKVRGITEHYYYESAESPDALTPDGRTLLLGAEIWHADGRRVRLDRPRQAVAGTLLLNEQTALVVYEDGYDPVKQVNLPVRGANAHLIDLQGRELGAFAFHGTTGAIGYSLNYAYLAQTRTHYLFDNTNGTVHLLPRDAPKQHRQLALARLPKFQPPQRPAEVRFTIDSEAGGPLTLYADTVTGALRYRLPDFSGE